MTKLSDRIDFNLAIDERMAMRLAVSAKSGAGTSIDDVADLVSSEFPELAGVAFDALRDRVVALIPSARFSFKAAQSWADAHAYCVDEGAAERQALSSGA